MSRATLAAIVLTSTILAGASEAQESEPNRSPLRPGVQSLAVSEISGSSGTFGYWRMRSDRMNVGWEIGLLANYQVGSVDITGAPEASDSRTAFGIDVGPQFRRYLAVDFAAVPFAQSGFAVSYEYQGRSVDAVDLDTSRHVAGISGNVGIGIEWFPVSRFSVSGVTGLRGDAAYRFIDTSGESADHWEIGFTTFTAGLQFRIYLSEGLTIR